LGLYAAMGNGTGQLQGGEEKEVCIVTESDVGAVGTVALEDAQLDDGWRINGSPVGGGCRE
jgi:hypothetical protein